MNLAAAAQSSIGRKIINGISGLLLVGFVVGHLTGNFLLFAGPDAFNDYAYFLQHLFHGAGIWIARAGLLVVFASHAWTGYSVWANKAKARSAGYQIPGDAGGKSKKSISSTSMLYTGLLLLAFVIWHILQFTVGVIDNVNRTVVVDGIEMRNVYGLVIDTFSNPIWALTYLIIMTMLGIHLWHGIWSAFQSTGLANGKYLPVISKGAHALAALLALGFLSLPATIMVGSDYFQKLDDQYVQTYQVSGDTTNTNVSGEIETAEEGA